MDSNLYHSRFEREIEWHNTRAMLLDVHDNMVDIIELYCMVLPGMLSRAFGYWTNWLTSTSYGDFAPGHTCISTGSGSQAGLWLTLAVG